MTIQASASVSVYSVLDTAETSMLWILAILLKSILYSANFNVQTSLYAYKIYGEKQIGFLLNYLGDLDTKSRGRDVERDFAKKTVWVIEHVQMPFLWAIKRFTCVMTYNDTSGHVSSDYY